MEASIDASTSIDAFIDASIDIRGMTRSLPFPVMRLFAGERDKTS